MKDLIRELRAEHAVILERIDAIEQTIAAGKTPDIDDVLDFFRTYVDERHHAKEEGELFPRMRQDPSLGEIAGSLLEEHDEARRLAEQIRVAADPRSLISIYAENLRWHIAKENAMIFDAAESLMAP